MPMFDFDQSDRTEAPSSRRLEEARRSGYVPRSRDATHAVVLIAVSLGLLGLGGTVWEAAAALLQAWLSAPPGWFARGDLPADLRNRFAELALAAGGLLGIGGAAAVLANGMQFGFRLTPSVMRPRWSRLSPLGGMRQMRRGADTFATMRLMIKLVVVAAAAGLSIRSEWRGFVAGSVRVDALSGMLGGAIARVAVQVSSVLLALAVADWAYSRWQYRLSLRVSPSEARDEARLADGARGKRTGLSHHVSRIARGKRNDAA